VITKHFILAANYDVCKVTKTTCNDEMTTHRSRVQWHLHCSWWQCDVWWSLLSWLLWRNQSL